jgi:hypothetical protein
MARSLVDVHLLRSLSRSSDNDLTYCTSKRGAPFAPTCDAGVRSGDLVFLSRDGDSEKSD